MQLHSMYVYLGVISVPVPVKRSLESSTPAGKARCISVTILFWPLQKNCVFLFVFWQNSLINLPCRRRVANRNIISAKLSFLLIFLILITIGVKSTFCGWYMPAKWKISFKGLQHHLRTHWPLEHRSSGIPQLHVWRSYDPGCWIFWMRIENTDGFLRCWPRWFCSTPPLSSEPPSSRSSHTSSALLIKNHKKNRNQMFEVGNDKNQPVWRRFA